MVQFLSSDTPKSSGEQVVHTRAAGSAEFIGTQSTAEPGVWCALCAPVPRERLPFIPEVFSPSSRQVAWCKQHCPWSKPPEVLTLSMLAI